MLEPPRRGGSNEYTQSMFLSRNKKNNLYLCKPQFYYIKVVFKGVPGLFYVSLFLYVNSVLNSNSVDPDVASNVPLIGMFS